MKKKIHKKSQNLMALSGRCYRMVAVLVCLLVLASAATAETLDDCRDQTITGQNFILSFPAVELSNGTDGTFTIHARGDYSVSWPQDEYLTWDIDGLCSGTGAPAYGSVIQIYNHDDVEWEQTFTVSGACLSAATADSSVNINLDLSSQVHIYGPSFVCVELTYGSSCAPLAEPNNPDPCDGAINVPVDTNLAWNGGVPVSCDDLPNGGFESGFFPPWTTITGPGSELTPWAVTTGGTGWYWNGFPFEGAFFAQNGFDGDAGLFYDIYQEITIPANATSAILNWSERIQWDMIPYGATLPRQYVVSVQPAGGGAPLAVLYAMSLNPLTSGDTGYVPHSIDLLSVAPGIAGQTVRINFHETIPETYTGPAQFDLDAVSLNCNGVTVLSSPGNSPPAQPVGTPNFADYDDLREAALANQNVEPAVRSGDEPNSVKEEAAPEVTSGGMPVTNIGGPDCGGYTFDDSVPFSWIEIKTTGTNLNLWDDSYYFPINLPFNFDFYGTIRNQVAVGSNGTVHFVDRYMTLGNSCIPGTNSSGINSFIALYWDDLYPSGSQNVYYKIVGSAPNRILVVQWENVRHYGSSARVTAQAQLFETSSDILLLYADPSSEYGAGGTVGIQRDPTCGLQYLCNQPVLQSGLAILFTRGTPPCPGTTYDVYFGTDPCAMELIPDCNGICERNCDPTPGLNETLEECMLYYWQVVAENHCGSTAEGPRWTFTTGRGDGSPCNRDPNCRDAIPSITEIWPPNHKWVDIEILNVIDPDPCDIVSVTITGITQDEPVAGSGSGTTFPDGDGIGTSMARLRAERSGLGNGRVYEISFEATDNRGGVCNGAVQVCVPHSMGQTPGDTTPGRVCIDGGQSYDSTGLELLSVDLNNDGIINVLDFAKLADYWLVWYEVEQ